MAIDFHSKTDRLGASPLFQLSHTDYSELTGAFDEFERLTGVFVDPYGTTHLSSGHLETLAKMVSGHNSSFEKFLKEWGSKDEDLTVEGD